SYPGVTNKLLAPKAKAICVAYEGLERYFPQDKIIMTGNPVRKDLEECNLTREEAKKELGFDPTRPLILSVGGSLGARTVNEAIAASLDAIAASGAQLMWQTGRYGADEFQGLANGYDNVKATTFITRMDLAYRAADLVVSRAGAGTISELQILGKPVILIPSPNVAEDHQRHNAEALSTRGAAVMILDKDAVAQLPATITRLLDDEKAREQLSAEITGMAMRDSDEKIVDIINKCI
ncbi:MAG: UDP-N-acetylglucosamine--N-acetylmuramyl-(pentapeptide) pyrophosphoryl-undecaprenol N-acetylglucosamine transferase, partial [Duncaniella sp.]|nr:UDP-N-acetylglucosamine--N-acetylmuramyl-(pentapeptide) pyrophosphoryl-undecaprenol N-acetylglucosamine transferase [Duncaniella sp.]